MAHRGHRTLKIKLEHFHIIFLTAISLLMSAKSLGIVPHSCPAGSVSQTLAQLVHFFCYVEIWKKNYFFIIIYILYHRNVTNS